MGFDYFGLSDIQASDFTPGVDGVWIDFNFGTNTSPGAAAPDRINLNATDIEVLAFNGVNITEELHASFELDHMWKEGSIIKPHVHWYATTNDAGNVNWQMELVFVNKTEEGVIGATFTTINVVQAASGTAWIPQFAIFPDVDLSGFVIGTQVYVRLFRDPGDNDTYASDAALSTFGFHVQVDTLGSREVASK